MKTSLEILGLPVIDISEGVEIGISSKIVVNAIEGSVAALVVNDDKWYLGAKLLPFTSIAGLGESAITIITNDAILDVENAPELEKLLFANITIIGTKVLTKKGHIQGTVTEIIIDSQGKITACEMEELNGETTTIPMERILTFGKKVLVITDENEIVAPRVEPNPTPVIAAVEAPITPAPAAQPIPETTVVTEIPTTTVKENPNDNSAKKFDEKQRKYLLGKQASRRIETDNGVLIVDQGGEINEEVIQKAKMAGKFVELSMNIQ